VRHHVVHLPGDPQPFLGDRAARLGQLGLDPAFGLFTHSGSVGALLAHRDPDRPARGEEDGLARHAGRHLAGFARSR
jgi:hypothetical protein